jgi:hypothetical protein
MMEMEVNKFRSGLIGLFIVGLIFLSMALFFLFLFLRDQSGDDGRIGKLVIGMVTFFYFLLGWERAGLV